MTLQFDSKKLFDSEQYSDITIKIGTRAYRCHKLILCNNSEYFNALCGADGKFKESRQAVVELCDDEDPGAVEAVLRHIYGFSYDEIYQVLASEFDDKDMTKMVTTHIAVAISAQKYLLPQLGTIAITRIYCYVDQLQRPCGPHRSAAHILNVVKLLLNHSAAHAEFSVMAQELVHARLPDLFKLEEFRKLIETAAWKDTLNACKEAIERGHKTKPVEVVKCTQCNMFWPADWHGRFKSCPFCLVDASLTDRNQAWFKT